MDDAKQAIDLKDSKCLKRQNAIDILREKLDQLEAKADDENFINQAFIFLMIANRILRD